MVGSGVTTGNCCGIVTRLFRVIAAALAPPHFLFLVVFIVSAIVLTLQVLIIVFSSETAFRNGVLAIGAVHEPDSFVPAKRETTNQTITMVGFA